MHASLRLKLSRWLVLLAVCLGAALGRAVAQSQDDVTVAFLYNFARFVDWPATAYSGNDAPFVVGFVGRPALADKFAQAVQGKNVNGREIATRKFATGGEAANCQILFVGNAADTAATLAAIKGQPILCVGEGPEFLSAGGMISFSRDGPRLVFDVNLTAITSNSLKPADKLTKAARSVKGG